MDDNGVLLVSLAILTLLAVTAVTLVWHIIIAFRRQGRPAATWYIAAAGLDDAADTDSVKPASRPWSPDKIQRRLWYWPSDLSGEEVVERIRLTNRFIDFDGTLVLDPMGSIRPELRMVMCGKPVAEFLGEEPFVVQTWNLPGARAFFEAHPELSQPILIIEPPTWIVDPRTDPLRRDAVKDLGDRN